MYNSNYNVHPYFTGGIRQRLKEEYHKYGNLVIGFDFDNTIFDYHNIGGNFKCIIDILKECKDLGFTLCLYTSEPSEEKLKWKIEYCKHFGIEPDYVNESPIFNGTAKPFFNILLDDRAGLENAYEVLSNVIDYVKDYKTTSQQSEKTPEIL